MMQAPRQKSGRKQQTRPQVSLSSLRNKESSKEFLSKQSLLREFLVKESSIKQPLKDYFIPRRTHKRSQLKLSNKRIFCPNKTTMVSPLNRTAFASPSDKSALMSYFATPKANKNASEVMRTLREEHQYTTNQFFKPHTINKLSTEDDNYSEEKVNQAQTVKICVLWNDKKVFQKQFSESLPLTALSFEVRSISISKLYGFIGFESVPYDPRVTEVLNEANSTFKKLVELKIRQLNVTPCIITKPIDYEKLNMGDFTITKYLGSGGFSQVYLGKCKIDQQYCALKFIKKDTITTSKKVRMLENEKNILFSIKHPHLIDLYYAFESKNYIVFGLEYCPNGNLYSYLHRHKLLPQPNAKHIFAQILSGVQYLHQNNILFRDIKLENILFDNHNQVKITDFGLSKPQISENQITYSYCGSPQYMAPEMLAKSGHSYEVDFYALGILLYELLYGRSPFYATKKEDIFAAILNSEPKFPKTPIVSKQAKTLIKGLLCKQPAHRIGSLKGVKELLAHPWLKNIEQVILPMPSPTQKADSNELDAFKEHISAEKNAKYFDKLFFSQSFVNRELYQLMKERTFKFCTPRQTTQTKENQKARLKTQMKQDKLTNNYLCKNKKK